MNRKINIALIFMLIGVFVFSDISYALRVPLGVWRDEMARYVKDRINVLERGGSAYPSYQKALEELRKLGEVAVPYLLETLNVKKFEISGSAAEVLSYIAVSMSDKEQKEGRDKIVNTLIEYLMEYEGETYKIMNTLNQLLLIKGLNETDIFIINFFNRSINLITSPRDYPLIEKAKKQIPVLRRLLSHRVVSICISAVRLARAVGPEAREALPEIRMLTKKMPPPNEYDLVRVEAVALIGEIGSGAESAIPELKDRLKDDYSRVRAEAARSIGKIRGREAEKAVPELIKALKTGNAFAAEALGVLRAESAISVLRECSRSKDATVARASKRAIKVITSKQRRAGFQPYKQVGMAFNGINVSGNYISATRAVLVKKSSDMPEASLPAYILVRNDGDKETTEYAQIGYQRGNMRGIATAYGGIGSHLASITRYHMPWIVYISGLGEDFYNTVKTGDMLELDGNRVIVIKDNLLKYHKTLPRHRANRTSV